MMLRGLLLVLLCGGCLTRTDLGAEPIGDAALQQLDGGEGESDATDPERAATDGFRQLMLGRWVGAWTLLPDVRLEYEFREDSTYRWRVEDEPLSEPQYFFITDQLASGRYVGVFENTEHVTTATLLNMRIEQRGPDEVLSFDMRREPEGSTVLTFVLTKVP